MRMQKCHYRIGDRLGLFGEQGMPCMFELDELHTVPKRLLERSTFGGDGYFVL
jgi:hypothetical protein